MTTTTLLTLPDGRKAAVDQTRPHADRAVVFLHSAPGSRRFDPDPAVTAAAGINLVTIDRAGYGDSSPLPDGVVATHSTYADDVAAVCAALDLDEVDLIGWSAGGRVAAAVAARHPELVRSLAIVGAPAPDSAVPWMPDEHKAMMAPFEDDPAAAVPALVDVFAGLVDAPGSALVSEGEADARRLTDDSLRRALDEMVAEGFRQGPIGMALDVVSYALVDWAFDPSAIGAPTTVVWGAADEVVPIAHGQWWADQIAGARLLTVPDEGHLAIVPAWSQLL